MRSACEQADAVLLGTLGFFVGSIINTICLTPLGYEATRNTVRYETGAS